MTPKRLVIHHAMAMTRRRQEFALAARAALLGAQGEPKKTARILDRLERDP